jgi:hypothetical protein
MKLLRAFGRFWYDFIIGDDWKIAMAVVVALAIVFVLMSATGFSDHVLAVIGGALVVACFAVSLIIDVRSASRR